MEDLQSAPDSSSRATTRVTFDITVPAYMSNELQVRLESGDLNTTATFVRDESWSVSGVFPTNTDNFSIVTFADGNGAITLGTAEASFRTSTATSQTIQITADQFDTERWDSDNDGVSNLDELIAGTNPEGDVPLQPVLASLEFLPIKNFRISWQPSAGADFYRVLENPDGVSGFSDISGQLDASTVSFDFRVALYSRINSQYLVQSCNDQGCADSAAMTVTDALDNAIGYIKASNTAEDDGFGGSLSLSADGTTLAVGAFGEGSAANGIDGDQSDNLAPNAGAVYVFVRNGEFWQQQAYVKASNTGAGDGFGIAVSLSADGNTLAVGASREGNSGAVYVFVRSGELWQQQAYLKASNADEFDLFGQKVHLSADSNTLAVAAFGERSLAAGINGDQSNNMGTLVGAVYVFSRSDGQWQQQAYVKASNPSAYGFFGSDVSLSSNGNTLAVGARFEDGGTTGINGDQNDDSAHDSGAVYVFVRNGQSWQQQVYLKASNTEALDEFGDALSLSADGNTLAVGAFLEKSSATGVDADQSDNSARDAGAVYVFIRSEGIWQQQAYIKASNTDVSDQFGDNLSLSSDGNTLAVGAGDDSSGTGFEAAQNDNSARSAGAVYVFIRSEGIWQQQAYVKASNTDAGDVFSFGAVSLSADGATLAVGARGENSAETGINGDQNDNSANDAGAVYLY